MSRYKASGHCVGESNWHSRFTPGYRRPIFEDVATRELTVHYLVQAAQELQLHVGAIECGRCRAEIERLHEQDDAQESQIPV